MKILVTGSAGHLGEALVRTLRAQQHEVVGVDISPSETTTAIGSITDSDLIKQLMPGVEVVYHTATLHKPHIATHSKREFVETNIEGTLNLLEAAAQYSAPSFIFTSTTSTFGYAMRPTVDQPAAWITETVQPVPRNIYGVTKVAAEDLCKLFHDQYRLNCLILRTSRFFQEPDDNRALRERYEDANLKVNEYPHRRVDVSDVVSAHLLAAEKASAIGFGRYIISATTPFRPEDCAQLRTGAAKVLRRRVPGYASIYAERQWEMFEGIDRVYDNSLARMELGWEPKFDFEHVLSRLEQGLSMHSSMADSIGIKGYHDETFEDGPYPVEEA